MSALTKKAVQKSHTILASVDVDVVVSLHSQEVSTDKEVLQCGQSVVHASNGETSKVHERTGFRV